MGFQTTMCGAVIFLTGVVLAGGPVSARPQDEEPQLQSGAAVPLQTAAYPESPDGLKNLLQDWLAAIKAGDAAKSAQFLEGFAIPNHEKWFTETFGPTEGVRLEARYVRYRAMFTDWLKKQGERAVTQGKLAVEVKMITNAEDTRSSLVKAILAAEQQQAVFY